MVISRQISQAAAQVLRMENIEMKKMTPTKKTTRVTKTSHINENNGQIQYAQHTNESKESDPFI